MIFSIEILVIKIGTPERPAGPDDIEHMQKCLQDGFSGNVKDNITLVAHHAIEFETVSVPVDENGQPLILALGVTGIKKD